MSTTTTAGLAWSLFVALCSGLALTISVELPVAALLGLRTWRALGIVALLNAATNPPLNFVLTVVMLVARSRSLLDLPVLITLVVLEGAVVLAEWRVLAWALPEYRRRAFGLSLAMNASSLATGLAVRALVG